MPAKIKPTDEQIQQVKILFDQNKGSRTIAKELNVSRDHIQKIYKILGVYNTGRKKISTVYLLAEKECKICEKVKPIDKFRKRIGSGAGKKDRISYEPYCNNCVKEKESTKEYRKICQERRLKREAKKTELEKRSDKDRYNHAERKRMHSSPEYKMRRVVSTHICGALKDANSSKNNESCWKYLPYTRNELKSHIEKLFEPWMSWENWSKYDAKTWDDNNSKTWTWSLDHIIRQATLPYKSMEEENFKKCWALSNLRPLSAKQNLLENYRK
jgi:hypothetical protein